MALEAGVPVIPVAMIGTFEVQPQGKVMPRIKRVGIRFGAPLDFSRYAGLEDDRFVLRSMTDEIMYELMSLSNQEYVDIYAAKAKADIAAARKPGPPSSTPPPTPPAPRTAPTRQEADALKPPSPQSGCGARRSGGDRG